MVSIRALIRSIRETAATAPGWALPLIVCAAVVVLVFSVLIWPLAMLCMSMRPLYEGRGHKKG